MDFKHALRKCATDKELYKFLYKIRTNYIRNEAEIQKFALKGVKAVSQLLAERIELKQSEENDKIIEVVLSILGNCTCYNKTAAEMSHETSISDTLISIVNTSDNPSLQSKACRLIGNLAQFEKIATSLQQSGVALCLSNCIAEDSSPQVLIMATRAMRLMWNLKTFRHQILSYGTILKVVMCLHKILRFESEEEEKADEESNLVLLMSEDKPDRIMSKEKVEKMIKKELELGNEFNYKIIERKKKKKVEFKLKSDKESLEVVSGILKFLLTIVGTSLPQVARSIFADGFGIKILLFLTSEVKFRSTALKILTTFAYNSTTESFLRCSSDVVTEICDLLNENFQTLAASEQKYCLAIICLAAENPCSRLKFKQCGIFKIMLEIAGTTRSKEEVNLLLFFFFQFRFDESGLESLMRLNLANVLIKILSDLIAKMEVDHIANDNPSIEDEKPLPATRKRLNTDPLNYPFNIKYPRYESHRPASPIGSPSSSSGYGGSFQMSPSTSGYSPYNSPVRCYHDYDSDSNQYSPVCSDNEEDLDRMEAKVLEIIERKKAEGSFEEVQEVKEVKEEVKKDEKIPYDVKVYSSEEEVEEPVKDDFDILAYIYGNEEIGKSDEKARKKKKKMKKKKKEKHEKNSKKKELLSFEGTKSSKKKELLSSDGSKSSDKNELKSSEGTKSSESVKSSEATKSFEGTKSSDKNELKSSEATKSSQMVKSSDKNELKSSEATKSSKMVKSSDKNELLSSKGTKSSETAKSSLKTSSNLESSTIDSTSDGQSDNDSKPSESSHKSKKPENYPETLQKIEEDKMSFVLLLLWKVSLKYSDASAFVQSNNLQTLIKVCRLVKKPNGKIYQILQNIVEQTRNFVAIFLKQNLVFDIYSLLKTENHENCYSCDKMKMISRQLLIDFAKVGESGYGQGEIVHSLMTGDDETTRKIAVKLLYVVRCPEMLSKLLFDYRTLDIVMEEIFSNSELSSAACNGLTIMAENLNIKIPSDDETLSKIIPENFKELPQPKRSSDVIKFIVSDGEISLNKSILIESSEVFTSMLSSGFRESKFNEINFPTYTVEGMKYFHQLLIMQESKKLKSIAPKVDDIEILLQCFELSNLYIIFGIQQPLLNIIKLVIDETNVMKVFEWSLKNVNQDLLISSICYFLCSKIDGEKKLKLFNEANSSRFKDEWRKLIIDSISMKCRVVE